MKNITVNQNDIHTIRDSLKLPLFELIQHMNKLGWESSLSMPGKNDGKIYFQKRNEWNGKPLLGSNCSFGYRFRTFQLEEITLTAQRAAELCMKVYEEFGETIPSNPNIYGEIKADFIANKPEFSKLTYAEFLEKHSDKQFSIYELPYRNEKGLLFTYYGHHVLIRESDMGDLLHMLSNAKKSLSGDFAIND